MADENTALGAAAVSASGAVVEVENGRHGEGDGVALVQVHGGCGRWVGLMFYMSIGCQKEAKRQTLKNGNSKICVPVSKSPSN